MHPMPDEFLKASMPDMIASLGENGIFGQVSSSALAITGFTFRRVGGLPLYKNCAS
jgi:hypothetical protein